MMVEDMKVNLVVVGSIALDNIATQSAERRDVLGGSVSYACAAASFFTGPGMVGVIGSDFPEAYIKLLNGFSIDMRGLQKVAGKTFRWSGVYERDMNNRRTISTDLNVFASFSPELPKVYRKSPFLFLANIAPSLQLDVLKQISTPRFVAADTMDLWIKTDRSLLMQVVSKVDMLLLNDSEARELTGEQHLVKAADCLLKAGPRYIVIKKGEHGIMLFSRDSTFMIPAYPVAKLTDPTGAGDVFAGGMMGFLSNSKRLTYNVVKRAMVTGTVLASFAVEEFGLDRLADIERKDVDSRVCDLLKMVQVPRR